MLRLEFQQKDFSQSISNSHITLLSYLFGIETTQARFKRRATAEPHSIDRIKSDSSTAVARLGFKRRATAVPNSIHKL